MTSDDMKVSKGLEFPVVALPGVGRMPAKVEDEKEVARVFYVAATRATQRSVIGVGGDEGIEMCWKIEASLAINSAMQKGTHCINYQVNSRSTSIRQNLFKITRRKIKNEH